MPVAAMSTELVPLMVNVGFVSKWFKDKEFYDKKDKLNKYEATLACVCIVNYWPTGKAPLKRRNTLFFNRIRKNLKVLDKLRGVNTQSLFTLVHCPSF